MTKNSIGLCVTALGAGTLVSVSPAAHAAEDDLRVLDLDKRLTALEQENRMLQAVIGQLRGTLDASAPTATIAPSQTALSESPADDLKFETLALNSEYSFEVLDHRKNVNTKPLRILEAQASGELNNRLTVGGSVIALANYQRTNTPDKFGYLMRNPTSANQIGKDVSEAVIHSMQGQVTARITENLTAYAEALYNPEQSLGSGTITSLERNQLEVRRAFLLYGNLEKYPVYAAIGKMDTPFGLNETVNPFTNSTNWHAFSGLAYGAQVGWAKGGWHARAMAIQGGAQFRAHNTPVEDTNVPSRLNNFAVDVNYTTAPSEDISAMFGASYTHGSAYCQEYPVSHFDPCGDNVPAVAGYGKFKFGNAKFIAEYAETLEEWPGSEVPDASNPLSQFPANRVSALTAGGQYDWSLSNGKELTASIEYSRFVAGADESPWERQNQIVAGLSYKPAKNVNLFSEFVRSEGFVPLNFVSGGNFPDGSTWSDRDVETDVFLFGAQAAF